MYCTSAKELKKDKISRRSLGAGVQIPWISKVDVNRKQIDRVSFWLNVIENEHEKVMVIKPAQF